MKYRIGIDLGGTSAKIGLFGTSHKMIRETSVVTSGFPNPAAMLNRIAEACKELAQNKPIAKIGIGSAGDIDGDKGIVRVSPNLGWKNVPVKKLLSKKLKCAVVVDNDANAAAWGLYHTQISKSVKHAVVMTLGTGVGGGIIIDGKLLRGTTGSAGEVGHMNIEENGPLCNCGNRGCLETYVGGPHLIKKVRAALEKGEKSSLQDLFAKDPEGLTPYALSQAANKGDAFALSIWEGVGRALGIAVGDLVYILNPQVICFTGGIAQAKDLILNPLWKTLRERAFKTPVNAVKIIVAKDAAQIGVIGASLL